MNLTTLKTNLEKDIPNGILNLSGQTSGLTNLEPFLKELFDLANLAVSMRALNSEDKKLVLIGKTDLFKLNNLDIVIVFTEQNNTIHFHIKVSLPLDKALEVPGLSMSNIAFEYFGSGAENVIAFIGGHTTVLGKTKVSIRIALPALKDELYISASASDIPASPDKLIEWLDPGKESIAKFLPPGFGEIKNLSVSNFGFLFIPSSKTVSVILLSITADEIGIFPGTLAIQKFEFSLQINNPFAKEGKDRYVSGGLAGNFVISGKKIPVSLSRDGFSGDWNFRMVNDGWSSGHKGLNFGELLKVFAREGFALPYFMEALETITLERLEATFNLGNKSVVSSFGITITSGKWDIVPGMLAIDDGGVSLTVLYPADGEKPKLRARVWGAIAVGQNLKVMLGGSYDGALTLSGQVPEINIKNLLEEIFGEKIELPAFIPDISFTNLGVTFTPSSGEMSLAGGIETGWKFGEQSLTITLSVETSFNIRASGKKESLEFKVTLDAKGKDKKLTVLEGLELEQIYVEFSRTKDKTWEAKGSASVWLFERADKKIETGISYTYAADTENQTLEFSVTAGDPEKELFNFEGMAVLYGTGLAVKLTQDKHKKRTWELYAASRLNLPDGIGELDGKLSLKHGDKKTEIILKIEKSDFEIPLFPGLISARLKAAELSFGKNTGKWAFEASSGLVIKGLPQFLYDNKLIPDVLSTSLRITGNSITLTLKEATGLIEFDIPVLRFSPEGPDILEELRKLGKPAIQLADLTLSLGKQSYLSASVGFGFPEKLNNIFGVEENDKPSVEIFEVRPHLFKLKFGIGYENGIAGIFCVPDSSPFKKFEISNGRLKLDFGEYGLIDVLVPKFSSKGTDFSASLGFEVSKEKPLRFPLLPFKKMLEQTALKGFSEMLPNSVPIKGIEFFKDGKLQIAPLIEFLGSMSVKPDELKPIKEILSKIADVANDLPALLKDYLNISVPQSFKGDISITAAAGVNINIDAKDSPVKLIYPVLGGIPSMQGITLRGFSFGTIMGGSLFTMKIDADVDNFDLPSLLAGLLFPDIVPVKDFHQRLLVHNLFMVIAVVKFVPIPVPLFYDRLGIDFLGIDGAALNANASFKMNAPTPMGILKMISSIKKFFTDEKAVLANNPEASQLEFKLEDCYLQLPPFLGGAVLGAKGKVFGINAMDEAVKLLNLMKFFNPVDAILALPVGQRVGSEKVSFGPFNMQAAWLITSIGEFAAKDYRELKIEDDKKQGYLELIGSQPDKGLVTFLKGKSEIAGLAALETDFGLVVKKGAGMMTHYRIEGFIKDLVYFRSKGTAALTTANNETKFLISGETYIKVGQLEVFKGDMYLKAQKGAFDLHGEFSLFPEGSPVNAGGTVNGSLSDKGLTISAGITANFGLIVLTNVKAEVHYDDNPVQGVWISADFFGTPNPIKIEGTNDINIAARLPVLATTLNGKIILENKQLKVLQITANLFGFFDVHIFTKKDEAGATKNIFQVRSSTALPFWIDGECVCYPEHFVLHSVHIDLFPGSALKITAYIEGKFEKDKFHLYGKLQSPTLLGGIFDNCYIDMDNRGVELRATFLGKEQRFLLRDEAGLVKLLFNLRFLEFELNATLAIRADQTGGNLRLTGGIHGLFDFDTHLPSLVGNTKGTFNLRLAGRDFFNGDLTIEPGLFVISGTININLLEVIDIKTTFTGGISAHGFSLSGDTTLSFGLKGLPWINITSSASITNHQFHMRFHAILGEACVAIRRWRTAYTHNGFVENNRDWAAEEKPCYMSCVKIGDGRHILAKRLDSPAFMYMGFWGSYGTPEEQLLWPDDMKPGDGKSVEESGENFDGIDPMPLLTVANDFLFTDIFNVADSKSAEADDKRTRLSLSKCPVFLYKYPDPENDSQLNAILVFREVADDNELIKELKSEIRKSSPSKTSGGIVESKSMDIVFSSHGASGQTTITVCASNKTDFNNVSASFDFDKPAQAYHELALSV